MDIKDGINVEQHDFLRDRSVLSNLLIFSPYLFEKINAGLQVTADFSRAFDEIDHDLLIRRLAGYYTAVSFVGLTPIFETDANQWLSETVLRNVRIPV